jgi:hypothetical protein
MLYLFLAVVFPWRGYSAGSPAMLCMGAVAGVLAPLSALFSRGSTSFKAGLLALIVSAISSTGSCREKRPVKEESELKPGG